MTPLDTAVQGLRAVLQQDYQRFLQLGSRRAPHNLHVHESGYRSGTINTDALGLRYSHHAGKRFSAAERGGVARINLLVGGSTAMGIGASSDEHTVASHLSMLTGEVWLSLAGCGLNASQELLLFLTHQHRLGEVGHVVLLSGLNTLAHEALGEVLAGPTIRTTPRPTWPTSQLQRRHAACWPDPASVPVATPGAGFHSTSPGAPCGLAAVVGTG